jgi:hypothetical protein
MRRSCRAATSSGLAPRTRHRLDVPLRRSEAGVDAMLSNVRASSNDDDSVDPHLVMIPSSLGLSVTAMRSLALICAVTMSAILHRAVLHRRYSVRCSWWLPAPRPPDASIANVCTLGHAVPDCRRRRHHRQGFAGDLMPAWSAMASSQTASAMASRTVAVTVPVTSGRIHLPTDQSGGAGSRCCLRRLHDWIAQRRIVGRSKPSQVPHREIVTLVCSVVQSTRRRRSRRYQSVFAFI